MSAIIGILRYHVRRARIQVVRGENATDRGTRGERPPKRAILTFVDIAVRPVVASSPEKAKRLVLYTIPFFFSSHTY